MIVKSRTNWQEGERYLAGVDEVFAKLISKYGSCTLAPLSADKYYGILLKGIFSQQVSPEAAQNAFEKFACIYGPQPQAEKVLAAPENYFISCGIAPHKIAYIKDLSAKIVNKEIQPECFDDMADEEIIKQLSNVKGLGRWTAEIFLILAMNRPDVLPADDNGLQKAIKRILDLPEVPRKRGEINALTQKWRPWRSLATWYMWQQFASN